mgnify:CR=1 FL=1|uniref:Response regulator n=1 Tax=Desulfacinum infernum TaxID=35837 RepID=A0A832EI15_9BACT
MDRPFRILVTDRNRHVRAFLKRELSREGYEVMEAKDCRELQKILRSPVTVDLLVFDPDIAFENYRNMIQLLKERYPSLPVVLHSFWEEPAAGTDVAATVPKTGSPRELKAAVARLLTGAASWTDSSRASVGDAWRGPLSAGRNSDDHGG